MRFLFYKVVIKIYSFYLSWVKKIGWYNPQEGMIRFIFNQKFVHVLVILLTILIVFGNFANKTKAGVPEVAQKTVLANLVQSEFGELGGGEELVEEFYEENNNISQVQQKYLNENLLALRNEPQAQIDAEDGIAIADELGATIQGGTALVKPKIVSTEVSVKPRNSIINYTVQSGDTISTIAQKFSISVNTILWENNLSSYSLIRPGQILRILPFTGVTHEVKRGETLGWIASKYNVDAEKIMDANKMTNANQLSVGQKLLIPNGSKSSYASRTTKTSYTGVSVIRDIVKSSDATPVSGNMMNWPTEGHVITQYYSWRHHGLDIANKMGTPIYAADAGTIEYAGWSKGYGYNILINHGGGKKTRYAHLSKFYVSKGDSVNKGQNIAAMGSTGWSTGPHLHFEVIINGVKYNPLNYIR